MNDNEIGEGGEDTALQDEAVEWLVRLRGEDAAALKGRFEQWRRQSSAHREAYAWAQRHFDASEVLKTSGRYGPSSSRTFAPRRWWLAGGLLAAAAAVMLAVVVSYNSLGGTPAVPGVSMTEAPLVTKRGEIRSFRLQDGSSVTLDTGSRLAVSIDGSERRVRLEHGKARFAVAADERPFIVTAGAGQISARTGIFDVGYHDSKVSLTLISGEAEVRPAMQSAVYTVPVRQVFAGQRYAYRASDFTALPQAKSAGSVDERQWPSGWFEYRSVPLNVLVAQANRYADRPILLDDPDIAALKASGRFRLTDTASFAGKIAQVFDLEVSSEPDGLHLRRR